MKKIVLFLLLFPGLVAAQTCIFEWDASQSANVVSYSLYRDKVKIKDKIIGLNTELECRPGEYSVSAVNNFEIESALSEPLVISTPETPKNLKASLAAQN